jgi:alkaline phosphatase D
VTKQSLKIYTLMQIYESKISIVFLIAVLPNSNVVADTNWQPLPTGTIQRIAFGSCAMQFKPQPIWNTIAKQKPDLFLFLGDNIYGDFDGEKPFTPTEETLKRDWDMLANEPNFKTFRAQVPVMATWDNHDYGKHNGGAEFELKEMTKSAFLDFFGEPKDSQRRKTPGIYDAKIFGPPGKRVQVIMLDTRYFKGPFVKDPRSKEEKKAAGLTGSMGNYLPTNDPDVTLLGKAQWLWLEEQLTKSAEVRLIVSSTQVIPDEKAMDEWGNYPLERQRLFNLIKKTKANGVIILSGNVHFTEISKLGYFPYPLMEFTSSGLTHANKHYANAKNTYRIAGPYAEPNFGMIEIDWGAKPSTYITLSVVSLDGGIAFSYSVALSSLR